MAQRSIRVARRHLQVRGVLGAVISVARAGQAVAANVPETLSPWLPMVALNVPDAVAVLTVVNPIWPAVAQEASVERVSEQVLSKA